MLLEVKMPPDDTRIAPEQLENKSQEDALRFRLRARFGEELLKNGFIAIPNTILDRFREVGMTPTECALWACIIRYQYGDDLPWPSEERIGHDIGKSQRTVRRYVA